MKPTPLFGLLGLLALIAVAATAFLGRPEPYLAPTGLQEKLFPQVNASQVYTVRLQQGDRLIELTRQPGGYWELPTLGGFPAGDLVNSLPEILGSLQIDDRFAVGPEALPDYGLTPSKASHLELLDSDHRSLVDLWVGCTGPDRRGGYVRRGAANEVVLSFDSRISQLPLTIHPWTRWQMGLLPPEGMSIALQKAGIDRIEIEQHRESWELRSVRRNSKGEALEDPDPNKLRMLTSMASNLVCDGVFPLDTRADSLEFAPDGPWLKVATHTRGVIATVRFGRPRVLPDLIAADGQPVLGPVVPMRIQFQIAPQEKQDPYAAWLNAKTAERLFWLRPSGFDQLFLPHDQICIPKPAEAMPADSKPAPGP